MTSYGGGRDANPGGPGGRRRKIQTNKPQGKTSHRGGGGKPPKKSSGSGSKSMVVIAVALLALPISVLALVIGYLAHGYGAF